MKSDIFFYPTDFKETYCITVLEAMCSKCLVVTVKLAALTEIVEGKGILCDYPFRDNIDEDEDDEECVYYTQEYFEEQEKKLQEMDKDSLYYKFFEKQLIENKIKNNIPV